MAQKPKNFTSAAEMFFSSVRAQQEAPQEPDTAQESPQEAPQAPQDGFTIPKGYILTKESKSVRMGLLIRPTTKKALRKAADMQGLSMNDLINQLIEDYLEREGIE